MIEPQVLVDVERSGMVESVHGGHVVVVDSGGVIVGALGDPDAQIYPRSAVKPFQAIGMLDAGLDLEGPLLALSTASHSGEPFHVEGVREILAMSGLTADDLQCPPDLPYGEAAREAYLAAGGAPERILMNCSGKHAAMLRTCIINGWETQSYLDPGHPLQRHLHASVCEQVGVTVGRGSTDGCGAPLWPMPLVALARGFLGLNRAGSGRAVAGAFREHPEYCGGTDRDITALLRGVPGLVAKDGAEAVQAMVVEVGGREYAVALKIADGGQRARVVAAAAVLAALGVDAPVIAGQIQAPVLGGGKPVGSVRPAAALAEFSPV